MRKRPVGTRTVGQSRAGVVASRDLTRNRIVQAGLEILDREGLEAVTMRSVGAALGVTAMALYKHVSGKDDLMRAIAEHVLEGADFDGRRRDWRAQVVHCFDELRSICLRHPGLARLLEEANVAPSSAFAPMEVTVAALQQAGLDDIDALRTYFALVGLTLAQAGYQARGPILDLEPAEAIRSRKLEGKGYATVESLELTTDWDFDGAFAFGVRLVLDGVEAAVRRRNRTSRTSTVEGVRSSEGRRSGSGR